MALGDGAMTTETRKIQLIMELRRMGITDTRVLAAIERVPREVFVPPKFAAQAYDNTALPIGQGQTISQPYVVAYMTEKLALGKRMSVLEVGTGSGYQAAVLAPLCRRVYTIERHRALYREVSRRLANLGLQNVFTRYGDGAEGWPEQAPFSRIIVTAATPEVPPALVEQLVVGGLMVLPLGPGLIDQEVTLVRRTKGGHKIERLIGVRFVPLVTGSVDGDED